MTREKDDPEKRNLLNVHREDKKRRQYSASRNKIAENRSCESSNSEHRKRSASYKISSSTEQRPDIQKSRSQNMVYPTEKKDSWWCWQNAQQKKEEDTFSCVSCALKKIVSSEYACIGCLLLLFTISIIVAFLVVFKNVPNIGGDCKELDCKKCNEDFTTVGYASTCKDCKDCGVADSERLKRKIDMLSSNRLKKGLVGLNEFEKNNNKRYDDALSGNVGHSGVPGIEFGPSFRELNSVEESNRKLPSFHELDFSTILYSDKNSDPQSNEKLREFYKKLVQTDEQIKSLKKISRADTVVPYVDDNIQMSPERSRRSLKLYHYPKSLHTLRRRRSLFNKRQKANGPNLVKAKTGNNTRLRRFGDHPENGFIIEKKKLLVQYKPSKQRIPVKKCQHAPKDSHTHEKQLMHPFYKNTQRFDELLDKFLNKNLPEIISDPFGLDEFFKHDKSTKLCKHPTPHKNVNIISDAGMNQIPKPRIQFKTVKNEPVNYNSRTTSNILKMLKPECTTKCEKDFFNHEAKMIGSENKKLVTTSTNDFEVMLSVSTIMNPDFSAVKLPYPEFKASTKSPYSGFKAAKMLKPDRNPKTRRLMQVESGEDEEVIGYEDFKEVLTDDMQSHDETEKAGDRKRRDSKSSPVQSPKFDNSIPPFSHVQNPNWKGAMPLYPDEINSMMTNKEPNKMDFPKTADKIHVELLANQRHEGDLSDVDYIEDYLANKYDKLVQQAQAYSDYGVLDGKKESRNEKDSPTVDTATNHKIKFTEDDVKASLLGKIKGGRVPRAVSRQFGNIRSPRNEFEESVEATVRRENNEVEVTSNAQDRIHSKEAFKSEGIRIEIKPTTKSRDDAQMSAADILKIVSKHVKIKPKTKPIRINQFMDTSLFSTSRPISPISNSSKSKTETTTVFKTPDRYIENDSNLLFDSTGAKRRLLATGGLDNFIDFRDNKSTPGHGEGNTERDRSSFNEFLQNLQMKSNVNETGEEPLKEYMEKVKNSNIRIFSTPNSYNVVQYSTMTTGTDDITLYTTPANLEEPIDSLDSVITINNSEVKTNDNAGNNFFGKILLTVNNPEFDAQIFKLLFDVPLDSNLKDDPILTSDNYQFENFTEVTTQPDLDNVIAYTEDVDQHKDLITKGHKRHANISAKWVEIKSTKRYANEDSFADDNETDQFQINPGNNENIDLNSVLSQAALTNDSFFNLKYFPISRNFTELTRHNLPHLDSSEARRSIRSKRSVNSSNNMTLSDFFSVISNWFKTLNDEKVAKPTNTSDSGIADSIVMVKNITSNLVTPGSTTSTESAYPMYDSDMIKNIGHRSRVLLSIDDNIANVTENTFANNTTATNLTATGSPSHSNVINTTIKIIPETDLRSKGTSTIETEPTKEINNEKTKAIVKRHADESNLIFWNDIYDDEYGIQTDKMDNYLKDKLDSSGDKLAVKENDFIKRSGRWVQNKIKKFAKNLKINPHSDGVLNDHSEDTSSVHSNDDVIKERVRRSNSHKSRSYSLGPQEPYDSDDYRSDKKHSEEMEEMDEDYPVLDPKSLFAALSQNMKEVCKKAAKAVQQTKNRMENFPDQLKNSVTQEEAKQGTIASALMQQLVRLLTDLVDYQVQQKTCAKLPADLEAFLDWLVNSKEDQDEEPERQSEPNTSSQEDEELIEQLQTKEEVNPALSGDLEDKHDQNADKARFESCLRNVQDLLSQYDDMTVDEKSKMIGVKSYLEKQLGFLNSQISTFDLFQFLENHDIIRNRRDLPKKRRRTRENLRKYIKNFGKHAITTTLYEDAQITDVMNRKTVGKDMKNAVLFEDDERLKKRNLKDVYYRAVAEAKKFSTAKGIHKKATKVVATRKTSTMIGLK